MRNQQDGGPPLRLTQRSFINNTNNTSENNNNGGGQQQQPQNNGGPQPPREVARAAGFNFAGFRFRFGVVLTTHQSHRHVRVSTYNSSNLIVPKQNLPKGKSIDKLVS